MQLMDKRVSKSRFKARALEYMRELQESGSTLVITDRGRPVLRILPYTEEQNHAREALRNSVLSYERPTDPVDLDAWKVLR